MRGVPQPGEAQVPPVRPGGGTPARGYTTSGIPHQNWPGGNPCWGYPSWGHGTPSDLAGGGVPLLGSTPPRVPPQSDLARGTPTSGTPPIRPGWGVPLLGVPHLGYPLPPDGVLDMLRSVCLLRSSRRTFLLYHLFTYNIDCIEKVYKFISVA